MKSWKSIAFLGLHTWWQPKCSFGNCRHTRWHRKGSQELDKRTQWLDDLWYSNTNAWAAHEWQLSASVSDDCPIIPHSLIQFVWINVLLRLFYRFFFAFTRIFQYRTDVYLYAVDPRMNTVVDMDVLQRYFHRKFDLLKRKFNFSRISIGLAKLKLHEKMKNKSDFRFKKTHINPNFRRPFFFLLINCIIWLFPSAKWVR